MITGMMRIKNEGRWIERVLNSALSVCDRIYVLDDHSTDNTAEICHGFGDRLRLYSSPFSTLDEARDKNWLLHMIRIGGAADWILSIDGDEVLENPEGIRQSVASGLSESYSLRILYLWDRPDQVRMDGVYSRFWRVSLFHDHEGISFRSTANGCNFHCGNVPWEVLVRSQRSKAFLLHLGYMDVNDRKRKFEWYNRHDPHNISEDQYVHMIQGDPGGPSVTDHLRHAGPLTLSSLSRGVA